MSEKSFRPDVFRSDPPTLLGSRCAACERRAFPPRDVCPSCGAFAEAAELTPLSGEGVVYSFTVVRQAPPGLQTPYVLGYVDLPADRVRVMARIEGVDPDAMEIGIPVALTARRDETSEEEAVMFAFRPRAQGEVAA